MAWGVAIDPEKNYILVMTNYKCPKCGGTDFFMSKRNVMTGIGGIWGNRGGVKEFPVCRVCDEIMAKDLPAPKLNKFDRMSPLKKVVLIILAFVGFQVILALISVVPSLFGS